MGCSNPAEARDPQLSPTAPRTPKGSCGRPRPGHERAECVLVGRAWAVAPGCHAAEGDPQPGVGTRAEAECKGKRLLECCTKSFQSENVTNHRRERRPHVWHAPQKPPPPRWAQATARARDRPPEQMSLAGRAGSAACLQQKPAQGPGAAPLTSGRGGPWAAVSQGVPRQGGRSQQLHVGCHCVPKHWHPHERHPTALTTVGGWGGALLLCVHEPSPARPFQDTAQTPFSAPRIWGPRLPPRAASPALRTVTVPLAPATGVGRGTALGPRGAGSSPGKGRTRGTGAASPGQAHALRPIRIFRGVPAGALPSSWERGGLGQGAGRRASLLPPATSPLACGSAPPPNKRCPKEARPRDTARTGWRAAPGRQGASLPPRLGAASLSLKLHFWKKFAVWELRPH